MNRGDAGEAAYAGEQPADDDGLEVSETFDGHCVLLGSQS